MFRIRLVSLTLGAFLIGCAASAAAPAPMPTAVLRAEPGASETYFAQVKEPSFQQNLGLTRPKFDQKDDRSRSSDQVLDSSENEAPTRASVVTRAEEPAKTPEPEPYPNVGAWVWDSAYKTIQSELCPPNSETDVTLTAPFFGSIAKLQSGNIERSGLIANAHGEFFTVRVIGTDPAAVEKFTTELKGCFDRTMPSIPSTSTPSAVISSTLTSGTAEDSLKDNKENLFIELHFLGAVDPAAAKNGEFDDNIKEIVNNFPQPEQWPGQLREVARKRNSNFLMTEELLGQRPNGYVIDFILDPRINAGVTHQFREYRQRAVFTTVRIGTGRVAATLCGNGRRLITATVDSTGTVARTLSHTNPTPLIYDLSVRGLKNKSTYRLSGRWLVGFFSAPPTGSRLSC